MSQRFTKIDQDRQANKVPTGTTFNALALVGAGVGGFSSLSRLWLKPPNTVKDKAQPERSQRKPAGLNAYGAEISDQQTKDPRRILIAEITNGSSCNQFVTSCQF
ncbi:unnamed protein product [Amoebophrya sp. A25]|nr:unnamed protein product [Amoebophrya sp. A25]|eukprot:GSA25T00022722001.1